MTNTQLIENIRKADPFKRLMVLTDYIDFWVNGWPKCPYSFNEFFIKYRRKMIPGTAEYYKSIATHCFYCNTKFELNGPFEKTIDHWTPKAQGTTEKYVICCFDCNNRKADTSPIVLISQFLKASIQAKSMWGYHGKKLTFIAKQLEIVTNDVLYNIGPEVYYFKR